MKWSYPSGKMQKVTHSLPHEIAVFTHHTLPALPPVPFLFYLPSHNSLLSSSVHQLHPEFGGIGPAYLMHGCISMCVPCEQFPSFSYSYILPLLLHAHANMQEDNRKHATTPRKTISQNNPANNNSPASNAPDQQTHQSINPVKTQPSTMRLKNRRGIFPSICPVLYGVRSSGTVLYQQPAAGQRRALDRMKDRRCHRDHDARIRNRAVTG